MKRFYFLAIVAIFVSCGDIPLEEVNRSADLIDIVQGEKTMEYNPIKEGLHFPSWLKDKTFYVEANESQPARLNYGFVDGLQLPVPELLKCFEGTSTINMALFKSGIEVVGNDAYQLEIELDPTTNSYGYGGDVKIYAEKKTNGVYINGVAVIDQ